MNPLLDGLCEITAALAPELADLELPEETLADCSRCAMLPKHGEPTRPWHFNPNTVCCTHHPTLANYLVGRALMLGGDGARLLTERLAEPDGILTWGLVAPLGYHERAARNQHEGFGRDEALLCPLYLRDTGGCSIWHDRNSVCRTWLCKSVGGLNTQRIWSGVRDVLSAVESRLADYATSQIAPPDTLSAAGWSTYYQRCAEFIEALPRSQEGLTTQSLLQRRQRLGELLTAPTRMPDILQPSVGTCEPIAGGVRLTGYSPHDGITLPSNIFELLGRLDGRRTWQQAAALAQREAGVTITAPLVERLYALGIVRSPVLDDEPDARAADRCP